MLLVLYSCCVQKETREMKQREHHPLEKDLHFSSCFQAILSDSFPVTDSSEILWETINHCFTSLFQFLSVFFTDSDSTSHFIKPINCLLKWTSIHCLAFSDHLLWYFFSEHQTDLRNRCTSTVFEIGIKVASQSHSRGKRRLLWL